MSRRSREADDDEPVSRGEFRSLMGAISDLDSKLSAMKKDISRERQESDDKLVKRIKLQKETSFKKKGNEKQFRFNEEVQDKLAAAATALEATPPEVQKAKDLPKEVEDLLDKRQKLIKIADRSEHGWTTVDEYMEDELAADSDDEKRLFRAESRAGRKLRAKAAKNKKPASAKGRARFGSASQPNSQPHAPPMPSSSLKAGGPAAVSYGPCFQCGKFGHFRRSCPLVPSQSSK